MAAELIEAGVDVPGVYRRLYEDMPLGKLALLALALARDRSASTTASSRSRALSAEDFERAGRRGKLLRGDHRPAARAAGHEGRGARARASRAASARGQRKVSLRATDDEVDVSAIARAQGGGGHRRAAGFSTALELAELVAFLREAIAAQLQPSSDGRNGSPDARRSAAARDRRWTASC